jgi:ketosteroid isomerase-like protein
MERRDLILAAPLLAAAATAPVATAAAEPQGAHYATVKGVITAWRRGDLQGVFSLLADDITWYSHVGSAPFVGKAAAVAAMTALAGQMREVRWRIFHYAEAGDAAFTEGVDDFASPEGRRVALPYAGIMRFRDGKIVEWRDYFDRGLFDRLKAGEEPPPHIAALAARTPLF